MQSAQLVRVQTQLLYSNHVGLLGKEVIHGSADSLMPEITMLLSHLLGLGLSQVVRFGSIGEVDHQGYYIP